MLSLIRKIISAAPAKSAVAPATANEDQTRLAACVLLLEAAHSDDECTKQEMERVVATMQQDFSLEADHVAELIELANASREEAIDLWQFTNQLNQQFSKEQKLAIMESVWRIIFADGRLDAHEDHFAHKLANLLRLSHGEMIDAKLSARGGEVKGSGL